MTDAELQAVRERCEKATAGPWIPTYGGADWSDKILFIRGGENTLAEGVRAFVVTAKDMTRNDALFVAHAPVDIDALLDEIDRLKAAVLAERERCAMLADREEQLCRSHEDGCRYDNYPNEAEQYAARATGAGTIAAAIRTGETP